MHSLQHLGAKVSLEATVRLDETQLVAAGPRSRTPHPVRIATLAVAGSAAGFGLGPDLATRAIQAGITAEVSGLIRVLVLFLALIPYRPEAVKSRGMFRLCLLGGAGTMLGYYTFLRAIAAGVGPAATIVYYTYPGLVLVLSAAVSTRRLRLAVPNSVPSRARRP